MTYGACPISVLNENHKWQKVMERDPVRFMHDEIYVQLDYSRSELAKYVHCDKNSIVYFPNPTHAVSAVIDNIVIDKNDEILSTNLEYGSCDRMWFDHAKKNKYKYIKSNIDLPIINKNIS